MCEKPLETECKSCLAPYCSSECCLADIYHPLTCIATTKKLLQFQINSPVEALEDIGFKSMELLTYRTPSGDKIPVLFFPLDQQVLDQCERFPKNLYKVDATDEKFKAIFSGLGLDKEGIETFVKKFYDLPKNEDEFPTWYCCRMDYIILALTRIQTLVPKKEEDRQQVVKDYIYKIQKMSEKNHTAELKDRLVKFTN